MTWKNLRAVGGGLAALGLLGACQVDPINGIGAGGAGLPLFSDNVLSGYYVSDFSPFEATAQALRASAQFVKQAVIWTDGTSNYTSNAPVNARLEYARAVGLTGAGQWISIVDAGFLQSHLEFTGKTIVTPGGAYDPGPDEHGTHVASIAAGSKDYGEIVGVAPEANLLLGKNADAVTSVIDIPAIIAANQQARAYGAVVQNNSWGVVDGSGAERAATPADFSATFGSTMGASWYNSMESLAQDTVVVFAASNDRTRTTTDLMAGLPVVKPQLENAWIAVVNGVPHLDHPGGKVVSAQIVSSRCLEAAAWCMAADGANWGASADGDTVYHFGGGTSYAAPQVAGAMAVLAEAFPYLSAKELRARLLASADNGFYPHDGYVQFSPSVRHGYDATFGHGFLNLKAALLPIGGSYVPRSDGSAVAVNKPLVVSGGAAGNALSSRLARYDMVVVDGLGGGFDEPADMLSAQAVVRHNPLNVLDAMFSADPGGARFEPYRTASLFGDFAAGATHRFGGPDAELALLTPGRGGRNFGVSLSVPLARAADGSRFRLGFAALHEADGLAGIRSLVPGEKLSSDHAAALWGWDVPVSDSATFSLSGSIGAGAPAGGPRDMAFSDVVYDSLSMSLDQRNVLAGGDRLTLALALPQAVTSGAAKMTLPVSYAAGRAGFENIAVPLSPTRRQVDLAVAYGTPIGKGADLVMSARRMFNDGNVAGANSAEAGIAISLHF